MAQHEIIAVRYGTARSRKSECYHRFHVYGEPDAPQDMDFFFYVLRGPAGTVVVDTGFSPEAAVARGRECVIPPRDAFARVGVRTGEVQQLVISHLHWDHVGNLDAFADAQLLVPEAELEFWFDPVARNDVFRTLVDDDALAYLAGARADGRVTATGDEHEVVPGVTAITVGGHSPGQQILVVETARGTVVLASDAVHFYEELALSRPFDVVVDLRRMYDAYALLRRHEQEGAIVVPGHDPAVTARFPAVGGDAEGIAVRIA
jgi:glyoxylase-like metal-dependent hydrolase (beta-lactamase superfamily II)